MSNRGYIAVDLDGTLAFYDGFKGPTVIGEPIPAMVERVKGWIAKGIEVRIMTARVWAPSITDTSLSPDEFNKRVADARHARRAIEDWTELHIGKRLRVTCEKDYGMICLYDDRAIQVEPNTGVLLGGIEVKSMPLNYEGRTKSAEGFDRIVKSFARSLLGYHLQEGEAEKLRFIIKLATEIDASTT